jgi:glyceraldehyde 3-phosphate dehydrogenase
LIDLSMILKKQATKDDINAAMKKASETNLKGYLQYMEDPIVSCDVVGNSHSAIFDSGLTKVTGTIVKAFAWYDNEWGYSFRVVDLAAYMMTL